VVLSVAVVRVCLPSGVPLCLFLAVLQRIQVITNARVQAIDATSITYEDKVTRVMRTVPFGVCVWSTGIQATEFTKSVISTVAGQDSDKAIVTDGALRMLTEIPHHDRVPKRIVKQAERTLGGPGPVTKQMAIEKEKRKADEAATATTTATANDNDIAAPTAADLAPQPPVPDEELARDVCVDERVYALGDCATTHIPRLSKRLRRLFNAADRDGDGTLSYHELRELCMPLSDLYPVMSAPMSRGLGQYSQFDIPLQDRGIGLAEFERLLDSADKNVRAYPATAQVASQQGKYLAKRFNAFAKQQVALGLEKTPAPEVLEAEERDHLQLAREELASSSPVYTHHHRQMHPPVNLGDHAPSFRYRHLGSLAYIGGETAAIDFGSAGVFTGTSAFWLWKSAYLNESVSLRTRLSLASNWFKTWAFGRDTAKP